MIVMRRNTSSPLLQTPRWIIQLENKMTLPNQRKKSLSFIFNTKNILALRQSAFIAFHHIHHETLFIESTFQCKSNEFFDIDKLFNTIYRNAKRFFRPLKCNVYTNYKFGKTLTNMNFTIYMSNSSVFPPQSDGLSKIMSHKSKFGSL